ncbi:MAG: sugar ABC transporter ATP-binding protein [Thermoprotei archaeon]|nr:MAG: sugar ABC transporter ATP-binding protein [Thermoprotei archaeon]RLF02159.1 MAG: sugar ABC transporter ATP-binding protein [Thermoprotei archaeon]
MVRVKLENITKKFGKVVAVDNVNLEIEDGEFMVFLGPSGCGKTTTLLMVAGIYKPTSGYIYFDDEIVNDLPPKDRNVGMVFQSYALYPHMSVFDNIAFPLKLKKVPKKEIEKEVREVAGLLRIEELLDRRPAQLSGGQKQRVALARALVKKPRIFLMDEPLSNLDAKLRVVMRAELKRLQKELGITTIYVTHDQLEAMTMADRIAVMNEGKIQQVGTPEELYYKPRNFFVAGFIGSPPMNFIEGVLTEKDGKLVFESEHMVTELPESFAEVLKAKAPSEVILGVRPEDIIIGAVEGIPALIYVIEPLGRDLIINLKIGDLVLKAVTPEIKVRMNEQVKIAFKKDKIHLFDKKTGKALI